MPNEFESILMVETSGDFTWRLSQLKFKISLAATLGTATDKAEAVRQIVANVAKDGDRAVAEYTAKFDNVSLEGDAFRVSKEELQQAHAGIDKELLGSLKKAIANVRKYQAEIFIGKTASHPGIRYTPLKRVGVCVPGAAAPLPSTVIMTAVPAQVAGVEQIAVVSPPRYKGSIHPVILAVCHEIGVTEVYKIGGAQAVAAMAWGTGTIGKVDKIVGPGNLWVQLAKREVFGLVDIDSVAGPSEVLVIANKDANPAWVAADMLSQAEHAEDSSAIVVTDDMEIATGVLDELAKQVGQLERCEQAKQSLLENSAVIVVSDINKAVGLANDFAPEHLQIQCGGDSRRVAEKIRNAGAIFIGPYTPVAVGDYWAGPSHTLPTGTSAKFFSALSSNDFVKSSSIIEYDAGQLSGAGGDIVRLARTEGLDAHARSVEIRIKK